MADKRTIEVQKATGRWGLFAVCRECGARRRTVMGIVEHILEEHFPLTYEEPE